MEQKINKNDLKKYNELDKVREDYGMNITNKMRGAIATCLLYFIISFIMENGDQMSWILITTGITIFIMGIFEQLFDWKDEKYPQDIKGEKPIEKRMKDIAESQSEVKE